MTRLGHTKYHPRPCLCGCGELAKLHIYPRKNGEGNSYLICNFIQGHDKRGMGGFNPEIHSPRFCLCGCGVVTRRVRGRFNRYIGGHENIGKIPWNRGKSFSEESRRKMSLARLGKEPANKALINLQDLYRLYVQEQNNVSSVSKKLGISRDSIKNRLRVLGWSRTTKESCSTHSFKEQMRMIRIKTLSSAPMIETPNKLEKLVYVALDQFGITHRKQAPMFNKFVVDVLFPKRHLVLEIFGRYWHELPVNRKKDFSKKKYLEKCGYTMEVLWDDEIKREGAHALLARIFHKYNMS